MDESRKHDLRALDARIKDASLHPDLRRRAYESKQKIMRQMEDKTLVKMRQELIQARAKGDQENAEKMVSRIDEYSVRAGYDK